MKLNNILLLFLVIFFIANVKAQEVVGYAHYAVVRSTDSINNTSADLSIINLYPFVPKVAAMMRFKLEFTTKNPMFNRVKPRILKKFQMKILKLPKH